MSWNSTRISAWGPWSKAREPWENDRLSLSLFLSSVLIHAVYPMKDIEAAQRAFAAKMHVGKIVLLPPPVVDEQESKCM